MNNLTDALARFLEQNPDLPAGDDNATPDADAPQAAGDNERQTLVLSMERKGRGGKTATIISGFTWPDDRIAALASTLKSRLGTGGAARGGEILIQGDRRDDVARLLRQQGHLVKGVK